MLAGVVSSTNLCFLTDLRRLYNGLKPGVCSGSVPLDTGVEMAGLFVVGVAATLAGVDGEISGTHCHCEVDGQAMVVMDFPQRHV